MLSPAWNGSLIEQIEDELPDSTFYLLLIALALAIAWVVHITYYNSRIIGLILTFILNKFIIKKMGHIQFGSFSFSVLSGKIMFRDVHFITEDYSVRVQDGWLIFRWWRPYIYKDVKDDLSHSDTRVSIMLDNFELHVYNRSATYDKIERLFGLETEIMPAKYKEESGENSEDSEQDNTRRIKEGSGIRWRDLIPVIKVDIAGGRFVFGNHLVPTSLSVSFEDAHMMYTTRPASTPFDNFMHFVKCNVENLRIMLVPSPKYMGMADEPPRFMGQGFVVMQSTNVELYFHMDDPGLVPHEPEVLHLVDGDVVTSPTFPVWGIDVKCGKGTDISYGPWADRQREHLWKIFFPADYDPMEVTRMPEPGQRRIYKTFDFRMNILAEATLDILFTKNKETQAIHMNAGPGSYVEVTIPWITQEYGYTTKVLGQLLHLDATTSLQYRSLLECETLEFDVGMSYPSTWNEEQNWTCDLTACKASIVLIYHHKYFLAALFDDWGSRSRPDICHFVPYTWHFNLIIKEFELITLANEYNWIDCSSQHQENAHLAFCGEMFDLSFSLPFTDYLPPTVPVKFFIRGESVDLRIFLPENNTSRHIIIAMSENMKITDRNGELLDKTFGTNEKRWRNITTRSQGWVDCWTTTIAAISISYTYHPTPIVDDPAQYVRGNYQDNDAMDTPEKEDELLIPLRIMKDRPMLNDIPENFDPTYMAPDTIQVEIEIGPSTLIGYGTILKNFLHVKENYFGQNQKFTDFYDSPMSMDNKSESINPDSSKPFDPRHYRPFQVFVSLTLHDVHAHLIKNCSDNDAPCPSAYLERLGFELDKRFHETKLQVLTSPLILCARDNVERSGPQAHLKNGHLALSGLQVRGHAMFSHEDVPLDKDTLEYGWLVEAIVGDIKGKLTAPQLSDITKFAETFIFLVDDVENELESPIPYKFCQHAQPQPECTKWAMQSQYNILCPTEGDVKYRLTRLSVDTVDVYLAEAGTALNLQVYPIRLSTCNLHGKNNKAGITALIQNVSLRQFVLATPTSNDLTNEIWLESGAFVVGPVNVDAAMALPSPEFHEIQDKFLKKHDNKTRRLWFLWPPDLTAMPAAVVGKCGCLGGCRFFGNNTNGLRFFNPSKKDAYEGTNTAVFRVQPDGADLGFGQSLLQSGQLVFDIHKKHLPRSPTYSGSFTLTRGYMSRVSPATPNTNTTFLDDLSQLSQRQQAVIEQVSDTSTLRSRSTIGSLSRSSKYSSQMENVRLKEVDTNSMNDYLPEEEMPDAYDTDRYNTTPSQSGRSGHSGSVTSLPESVARSRDRKLSVDLPPSYRRQHSQISQGSQMSSPYPMAKHDSRTSLSTHYSSAQSIMRSGSKQSMTSSARSPIMPHAIQSQSSLASQGSYVSRVDSGDSYTGSERFFSADDEFDSQTLTNMSDTDSLRLFSHSDRSDLTLVAGQNDRAYLHDVISQHYSASSSSSTAVMDSSTPAASECSIETNQRKVNQQLNFHDRRQAKLHRTFSADSSRSASTTSFVSAMSSQEDLAALVNLHGQMNHPITHSPLLTTCYTHHLTQMQCHCWQSDHLTVESLPRPSFTKADHGSDRTPTPGLSPRFTCVRKGFSTSYMIEKREPSDLPDMGTPVSDVVSEPWDSRPGDTPESTPGPDSSFTVEDKVSKTTAIVNLKGSVDILVSPLLLESMQRYVEAVTPSIINAHPSAILDKLHNASSSRVQSQHKLKKEKLLLEEQQQANAREKVQNLKLSQGEEEDKSKDSGKTSRMQVMFSLSKINICVLQASIVEEVISFSALENIRDLTCVSMMAICVDSITCQLLTNNTSSKALEEGQDGGVRKLSSLQSAGKKNVTVDSDEKSPETQTEDMVGNLHIKRIHAQLRRMTKNSNFSQDVILTAIPEHRSKVLFTFDKDNLSSDTDQSSQKTSSRSGRRGSDTAVTTATPNTGFIMFECGIEDIKLKAVKRSGYSPPEGKDDGDNISEHVHFMMETADQLKVPETGKEDDVESWQSRISIPSDASSEADTLVPPDPLEGDASSVVLEFKMSWFNFAAPPPMPNKRKVDFTRLDWNLLSSATPAINAWMNPSDRLLVAVKNLLGGNRRRTTSVMACLMTEALEEQRIHMPYRSRYNKNTTFSKALQEDPSCQIFAVLRRYIAMKPIKEIEKSLDNDTIPKLINLQKGILALTRQWKNILYMPILAEANFKSRRALGPYTVTFAVPECGSVDDLAADPEYATENLVDVDEHTSLLLENLHSRAASVPSIFLHGERSEPEMAAGESARNLDSPTLSPKKKMQSKSKVPRASIATASPYAGAESPGHQAGRSLSVPIDSGRMRRNESAASFVSVASSLENDAVPTTPPGGTPVKQTLAKKLTKIEQRDDEDLYRWMVRQQDYTKKGGLPTVNLRSDVSTGAESVGQTMMSQYSHDDSQDFLFQRKYAASAALQLADAQVLFRPLLEGIGLHIRGVKSSSLMKKFGGHLSLQGCLHSLRIDIVDSDMNSLKKSKGKGKQTRKTPRITIDYSLDAPSFLCESFTVGLSMKDIVDFEKDKEEGKEDSAGPLPGFPIDELEAKPTTTQVNFSVNCNSISQHVNMSLLRLVHQFVTMIDNINETRVELKQNRPESENYKRHRKQGSKSSSTGTESQSIRSDSKTPTTSPLGDSSHSDDTLKAAPKSASKAQERPDKLPLTRAKSSPKRFSLRKRLESVGEGIGIQLSHFGQKSSGMSSSTAANTTQSPIVSMHSVAMDINDTSSPALAEKTIVDEIKEITPKCWVTLYHLLALYSTMPETKTVVRRPHSMNRLPVITEESEKDQSSTSKTNSFVQERPGEDIEMGTKKSKVKHMSSARTGRHTHTLPIGAFTQTFFISDRIPLVIFGMGKVKRTNISAALSGLKLEARVSNISASSTYREKVKGVPNRKSSEFSTMAYVGHTMIELLEGVQNQMQTVVSVNIAKSSGLFTRMAKRSKEHNSCYITVGNINVNIPQHPVVLHGMMTRSSKKLSSTLQEFIRIQPRPKPPSTEPLDSHATQPPPPEFAKPQQPVKEAAASKPFVVNFKGCLQGLGIEASLLPSLKAQYTIGKVNSSGVSGKKARFVVEFSKHTLSFESKISTPEAHLPSQASIELPPFHLRADYCVQSGGDTRDSNSPDGLMEGLVLREGNYFDAVAEVGSFEHSLTTDLLNHLVFVQKVFMKEVNEVVQKVSGGEQPVPIWNQEGKRVSKDGPRLLYTLKFRLKGIQITATTPTSSAVRLETGVIELDLSNRVQTASAVDQHIHGSHLKLFGKAQVDLNLALGQLIKNPLFEEAEPEFTTVAFFKTRIGLRNALQDEMITETTDDQEALLITLTRPIIFVQPHAFDKAVLVWLNYKSAYDYWNEQMIALNKEAQHVIDKHPTAARTETPQPQDSDKPSSALGTLFLQLTVDDLGICLPLTVMSPGITPAAKTLDSEPGAAVVLTLESTSISACSCGSLVSKGKFTGFCLRFAHDFETSWDDWKPDVDTENGLIMNSLNVPEGTYEVCSRTANRQATTADVVSNAKWILNILWQMKGLDVHLDYNIGKRLNMMFDTLTSIATDEQDVDVDETVGRQPMTFEAEIRERKINQYKDSLPEFVYDTKLDYKTRVRLIQKEMDEQAKIVSDFRQLGASQGTIEIETKKLRDLEAAVFQDFRRDVMKKLQKKREKATALKDKLGLGYKPASHYRSRSIGTHPSFVQQQSKKRERARRKRHVAAQFRKRSISHQECPPSHLLSNLDFERLASFDEEVEYELYQASCHGHGPHRAMSIDVPQAYLGTQRVTFDDHAILTELPDDPTDHLTVDDQTTFNTSFNDGNSTRPPRKRLSLQDILASSSESSSDEDDEDFLKTPAPADPFPEPPNKDKTPDSQSANSGGSGGSGSGSGSQRATVPEPSVDFEVDIKVEVESGKWVLHPKNVSEDDPPLSAKRSGKKDRPSSGEFNVCASPVLPKKKGTKKGEMPQVPSASKLTVQGSGQPGQQQQKPQIENTVFFLPGVDIKVHYNSKITDGPAAPAPAAQYGANVGPALSEGRVTFDLDDNNKDDSSSMSGVSKRGALKKANLYAWLSLQKLPEEMIISPALLDFLEQAIEPVEMSTFSHYYGAKTKESATDFVPNIINMDMESSNMSLGSSGSYGASFPVDVVVYIRVQPSCIRANCLPVSKVECLLRLPSLDLVFSTKRSDIEANMISDGTPPTKIKTRPGSTSSSRERNLSGRSQRGRARLPSGTGETTTLAGGGLSVTGCLADFSLYIFHPYGGHKKGNLAGYGLTPDVDTSSYGAETGRKDSLSLNVEFVKVNISRSRKGWSTDNVPLNTSMSSGKLSAGMDAKPTNCVRFSAVCDIGSAAFKYDMRRLPEILAFPKAWYRRSLARRLFLGESNLPMMNDSVRFTRASSLSDDSFFSDLDDSDEDSISSPSPSSAPRSPIDSPNRRHKVQRAHTTASMNRSATDENTLNFTPTHHRRASSGDKNKVKLNLDLKELAGLKKKSPTPSSAPQTPHPDPSRYNQSQPTPPLTKRQVQILTPEKKPATSTPTAKSSSSHSSSSVSWETMVLFAVNLSRLDVHVNMGNVMGNMMWLTEELRSQGRLTMDSRNHKNMKITAGLGGSNLEAKGGIVGGSVDLQQIELSVHVCEDPDQEPDHRVGVKMFALESKLDYMGSSIMMVRMSLLDLLLSDEWRTEIKKYTDEPLATTRPALIFIHSDLAWDKFHMMISRSTTPDLLKMATKLEEFFTQQFDSSRRVLSTMGSIPAAAAARLKHLTQRNPEEANRIGRHHRHWQDVLARLSGCKLSMLATPLPELGTIIGGAIKLHGNDITLACFHGINFRSKHWALFSMKEPNIAFDAEVQSIRTNESTDTHIVQNLSFHLGHKVQSRASGDRHMATISRLSRSHYMPQPFTSVSEWFHYAFSSSEIKDLDNFPQMQQKLSAAEGSTSPTERRAGSKKSTVYNHDTEVIFAIPLLQMDLKTEHLQEENEPDPAGEKPVVECSFVTEFANHIFVSMDAEAILFIHDLVTAYLKEKEKGVRHSVTGIKGVRSPELDRKAAEGGTILPDFREFECKTWQMEPTVRLVSWAGNKIDPVGVDYILQKLGFSHARTTIPKWMQRGTMDPLDKILSVLMDKLIRALQKSEDEERMDL